MEDIGPFFAEFSESFAGRIDDDCQIAFPEALKRSSLDYSLNSLLAVDQYLLHLHKNAQRIEAEAYNNTIIRAGAYVGEVIRRNANARWHWIDYNDYMPQHPELQSLLPERNICTCAFLANKEGAMRMPLNKIARFIDEGPENSVHYFASVDIHASAS
jgi:hypothetical protein